MLKYIVTIIAILNIALLGILRKKKSKKSYIKVEKNLKVQEIQVYSS